MRLTLLAAPSETNIDWVQQLELYITRVSSEPVIRLEQVANWTTHLSIPSA